MTGGGQRRGRKSKVTDEMRQDLKRRFHQKQTIQHMAAVHEISPRTVRIELELMGLNIEARIRPRPIGW